MVLHDTTTLTRGLHWRVHCKPQCAALNRPALLSRRLPSAFRRRSAWARQGQLAVSRASQVEHDQALEAEHGLAEEAVAALAAAGAALGEHQQQQEQQQQQAPQPAVAVCLTTTLPPQPSLAAAVQQLRAAVQDLAVQYGSYSSGLVRLEVPVPRGCTPLRWLRGQAPAQQSAGLLHPRIYFSPRRSTAAETEGSAAAGAASKGCGSTAGAGAAWMWQGPPGERLGEGAMRDMQRFLSAGSPRVRAFGGARFDAEQQPAPEWADFGAYCFLIPRLEFLEASGCNLLACTVAWDAGHDPAAAAGSSTGTAGSADVAGTAAPAAAAVVGFSSLDAAVMDATAALEAALAPAAPAAGALRLARGSSAHTPDSEGWAALMDTTRAELNSVAAAAAEARAVARALADPEGFPEAEGHGEVWVGRVDEEEVAGDDINACTPMLRVSPEAAREEYLLNGQEGLDDLLAALDGGFEAFTSPNQAEGLTKVVLARRTDVTIHGELEPLALLEALQERDPRAYQLLLELPSGATFLGSTPECLYTRTGRAVASEAVAGTRARGAGGDVEQDFWLAFDLLRSHKDHEEFTVVRDWVQQALSGVCSSVQVDVAKSVLKQGAVQHLYGKLSGQLQAGRTDADLLQALHPTPAVCGRPREDALQRLAAIESFDRGYYAGPFGWVSQDAAEFVVAIRSALVHAPASAAAALAQPPAAATAGLEAGQQVSLYAGVGIVRGSDTHSEWSELDLKMRQYERLLQTVPRLSEAPNINSLWASLMVEELCRLGCNTFCVAPGSRSSPLTVAIAQHPRARVVLCIDERSLGFWAMGYGRATGRPAVVVTSSGTAVANLLPAVVEAAQSNVPLLMLTADRPAELRDTGANQTIDQVKLFGGYTRWSADLPAPTDTAPARSLLSTLGTAVRSAASGPAPGPVHLNCQFREPLAPLQADWSRACLQGLERWELSSQPYTTQAGLQPLLASPLRPALAGSAAASAAVGEGLWGPGAQDLLGSLPAEAAAVLQVVAGAQRGLLVVGELTHPDDVVAAAQLARLLRWPVAADVLSGLRAGVQELDPSLPVIHHMDHLLLGGKEQWRALRPDVVLQLGGHLTSKRLCQFLEWSALPDAASDSRSSSSSSANGSSSVSGSGSPPAAWVFADRHSKRHDQAWLLSHRLEAPLPVLAAALAAVTAQAPLHSTAGAELSATGGLTHYANGSAANGARCSSSSSGGPVSSTSSSGSSGSSSQQAYTALLRVLDEEVGRAVDAELDAMAQEQLSEPHVARLLARELPPGEGLFVGNSMPIRDLDMYATPAPAAVTPASRPQGVIPVGIGAPVAANRGASGIDGVLSTAAGFADGLGRGTTLVVGDLSFLHDINGLNLLRSGEMRPPLTVVLINNGGGGIFSFLPIAGAVPDDVFTPLWATPQHVDLAGMCRAQGIAHLKVCTLAELRTALHSAWALNRHSVIEVTTSRTTNVDKHRQIQAAAQAAMGAALPLLQRWAAAWHAPGTGLSTAGMGDASLPAAAFTLRIESASYQSLSLPLARTLTTPAGEASHRQGFILRVGLSHPSGDTVQPGSSSSSSSSSSRSSRGGGSTWQEHSSQQHMLHRLSNGSTGNGANRSDSRNSSSSDEPSSTAVPNSPLAWGIGEVAPLPGLSAESVQQAEQQLVLLCELLQGTEVPLTLALLGGRFEEWLERGLGVGPGALHPSVRAGLEAALLSAIAEGLQMPLAELLALRTAGAAGGSATPPWVAVNGLLDGRGTPQEAASAALALVRQQGFAALKIKVGRRSDPQEDAAVVVAVRQAVGPSMVLRADANRAWTLEQAIEFGRAAAPAGLQYIEEPVCRAGSVGEFQSQLAEFHWCTGLPVALDETVDEGLVGPGIDNSQDWAQAGVAALVLKPTILGGMERTLQLAQWAHARDMRAVVSSAFESSLGLGLWAELATAVDAMQRSTSAGSSQAFAASITHHGLATLDWFARPGPGLQEDPFRQQLVERRSDEASGSGNGSSGGTGSSVAAGEQSVAAISLSAARQVARLAAAELPGPAIMGGPLQRGSCSVSVGNVIYTLGLLRTWGANQEDTQISAASSMYHAAGSAEHSQSSDGSDNAATGTTVLFLHGFLGSAGDWAPLMQALSTGTGSRCCIALDLPGHRGTTVEDALQGTAEHGLVDEAYSLETSAAAVAAAISSLQLGRCVVVGYSLGARVALLLAARWPHLVQKAVIVSGTPGISGEEQRAERAARDDSLAAALSQGGVQSFLQSWYRAPLWDSLRHHPRFHRMLSQRQGGDARLLSTALASMSPGRAPSLWSELRAAGASRASSKTHARSSGSSSNGNEEPAVPAQLPELVFVVGELDSKFVRVGQSLCEAVNRGSSTGSSASGSCSSGGPLDGGSSGSGPAPLARLHVVPGCGHAVHVERPLELLSILDESTQ